LNAQERIEWGYGEAGPADSGIRPASDGVGEQQNAVE